MFKNGEYAEIEQAGDDVAVMTDRLNLVVVRKDGSGTVRIDSTVLSQ